MIERKTDHYFEGTGYKTRAAQSIGGCERLCLADSRCVAAEFYHPVLHCSLFDHIPASGDADDADIALKHVPSNARQAANEGKGSDRGTLPGVLAGVPRDASRPAEATPLVNRTELVTLANGVLADAGITAYKFHTPPPASKDARLEWEYEDGSLGEVLVVKPGAGVTAQDVASTSVQGQVKACKGQITKAPLQAHFFKGSEVQRIETRCAGDHPFILSYSIISVWSGAVMRIGSFVTLEQATTQTAEDRARKVEMATLGYVGARPGIFEHLK